MGEWARRKSVLLSCLAAAAAIALLAAPLGAAWLGVAGLIVAAAGELGRSAEALGVYDQVVDRYGADPVAGTARTRRPGGQRTLGTRGAKASWVSVKDRLAERPSQEARSAPNSLRAPRRTCCVLQR